MKILLIGAGRMGLALAYDLVRSPEVTELLLVDGNAGQLDMTRSMLSSPKVRDRVVDVNDAQALSDLMQAADGVVSAVPYVFNLALTRLAIEHHCHFCDLGGNNAVVKEQFDLDESARQHQVRVLPDCGLAPGLVSVLAAAGIARLDRTDVVHLRVGGLPLYPAPPLNYFLVFSAHGLINEYSETTRAIRNGRIIELESLAELETLEFPEPFTKLEAFTTSGGASTLPDTFAGKIRTLDYKTIRYPGHCEMIKMLVKLGLTSNEPELIGGQPVRPRAVLEHLINLRLSKTGPDVVLLRATIGGIRNGSLTEFTYEMIDHEDQDTGLTAMMRTTAFPASVAIQFLVNGKIKPFGVLRQELVIPPVEYIEALRQRGMLITESEGVFTTGGAR